MAYKSLTEKCNKSSKREKVKETKLNLKNKLQQDLERDLLRLFQVSLYHDIKLIVDTSFIFTHSCILQTRACRFYKFINSEFEVLKQNGISVFNIYNASFTYLQTFVENIYTNFHTVYAEDSIIKHLQEIKVQSLERKENSPLKKSDISPVRNTVTPDTDLYFTPKCSPTDLQKPFASSKLISPGNNVVSYYKIVSVDDVVSADEKLDETRSKEEDRLLEKELAEQDELLSSFQTILSKKTSKTKSNSLHSSAPSHFAKKLKPKPSKESKLKAPPCKANIISETKFGRSSRKQSGCASVKTQEKVFVQTQSTVQSVSTVLEAANLLYYSDMDVSTTGGDSGLDNSLICQPETSPREITVSETSGVDLTESTINDEFPNDETLLAKQQGGSAVSSPSSEVGIWESNDNFKIKSPINNNKSFYNYLMVNQNLRGNCCDGDLNEVEKSQLKEVKEKINDCQVFLHEERKESEKNKINYGGMSEFGDNETSYRNLLVMHTKTNSEIEMQRGKPDESMKNEKHNFVFENCTNARNAVETITSHDKNVNMTVENYNNKDDLMEHPEFNYFKSTNNDSEESLKRGIAHEIKTPPCTPKKIKKDEVAETDYGNEDLMTEVKERNWGNNNNTSGVSNYFIDASTLIDDDEIYTPPISLVSFKTVQNHENTKATFGSLREEQSNQSDTVTSTFPQSEVQFHKQKEKERLQGEIILKNSIPNYSKHDLDGNQVFTSERLRGGADHCNTVFVDDREQTFVPFGGNYFDSVSSPQVQSERNSNFSMENAYFEPSKLSEDYELESEESGEVIKSCHESPGIASIDSYNTSGRSGSPNSRLRNESAPIISGGTDFVEERKKKVKTSSQSHGEAWIVMFEDSKKSKSRRPTSSESGLEVESGDEKEISSFFGSSLESNRSIQPIDILCDSNQIYSGTNRREAPQQKEAYPVEKSSSCGYFLDFGKETNNNNNYNGSVKKEPEAEMKEVKRNNMFSMFIGIDDDSKSTNKKIKPALEKEKTFSISAEENYDNSDITPCEEVECQEDTKKSFYMFIESTSPNSKKKQSGKKVLKPKLGSLENKKINLGSQRNSFENERGEEEPEEGRYQCSSYDNSLPFVKNNSNSSLSLKGKLPVPLNKFRDFKSENSEPKITGWVDTKSQDTTSESWLRTNGIHINYKEKSDNSRNDLCLIKDTTFVMEENKKIQPNRMTNQLNVGKVSEGEKTGDSFVKLSDMDSSTTFRKKKHGDKMSQSISETTANKSSVPADDIPLSKSAGSEIEKKTSQKTDLYSKQVNKSLTRLFPNLSLHSLASLCRKDGDLNDNDDCHASQPSEGSSSLQSSVEPIGLEISTSETDVSSKMGSISRLGEDLLKMFLEEIGPDVVVEVAGRRIKAHKCILSSRCQYFAAMLSGGWVESAGNVISLQGFSYNSVHYALRYIYSGDSRIPESNIVELATLADMLCLDGLQEIISNNLKVKYCHFFHVPCSGCSVGVIDCLSIAAACRLDDLYRKCLRWITKYFVKIWPTESFGSLPKELLEKCYQHNIVHMTVDNVLDTLVNVEKVKGYLPNVRWAENVSRLISKLKGATVRYIAEHFSSVLTSDNFLALGKEADWNMSLLEDSLIESIKYLPPEQACWSHARLHRILSATSGPDMPAEIDWNEDFLKLLNLIAELVENNLIKQAPRASKSKAWRQMEPELRSRIQEAACLVLPVEDASPVYRRPLSIKKELNNPVVQETAKSRNFEIRQIKLAMTHQNTTWIPNANRPLSLQIDQRTKKDSKFIPLRSSLSTSSVRRTEPIQGIRKTQSRSYILGNATEPKKISVNPRYSEIKSRYLEPRSPQKSAPDKQTTPSAQKKNIRCVSSSDSSRNCSPALRPSNSKGSIPKRVPWNSRQNRESILRSESSSAVNYKRDRSFTSTKSDATTSAKTLTRLAAEENMSTDSLCTNSLVSEKEATLNKRTDEMNSRTMGKENLMGKRKPGSWGNTSKSKSTTSSPTTRRLNTENMSSTTAKTAAAQKFIIPNSKIPTDTKSRYLGGRGGNTKVNSYKSNTASPKTTSNRNLRNPTRTDSNLVNENSSRRRSGEVDSENNKKQSKVETETPSAVSRSGTFLKDEPTILKRPPAVGTTNGRV